MHLQTKPAPKTFYDVYAWDISPKLKKIDLSLKTSRQGISVNDASLLLSLSSEEIQSIMRDENIKKLDRHGFIRVMLRGSSEICGYLCREIEIGSPLTYTKNDIAYIYGLDPVDVENACNITGIVEATAYTLPSLFYHIPVA